MEVIYFLNIDIVKTLIGKIKDLDNKIKKIMTIGFKFSFALCTISVLALFTYETIYSLPNLFYAGISLLQSSLMFVCAFFICGVGFDTIKKQMI